MKTVPPIRILIADDHLVFRLGIRSLLQAEPGIDVVGEAATGERAIELYRQLSPDVLLLDLRMPQGGGIHVVQQVKKFAPEAKILVLTSYEVEEEIYQILQAGARGYALKDIDRTQLVEALRRIHAGEKWIVPTIANRIAERAQRPPLTAREIEVLRLLVRGLTNREIAGVLQIADSTIKNHVNNIISKLDVSDRTEAVAYSLSRGIIAMDDL
ncbi:response regulator [Acidipila rosea]|uniref:LuxR family two component transcriptional regulator n=1 Tax=Acidipila rosea TaxID=768535 RepID=A0A4R1L8I1_9BACT|nr:response regulator transcription factor [Acidipila rosea]MBW4026695.1 response regulator transcription factor [Acidobacteriota bacterium]MBW4044872.1 response regulator transcription factor [Acidobacteriota bacterium]TCK73577.1 LuxR family two component transcriptional regulator [Acidipila rosea]